MVSPAQEVVLQGIGIAASVVYFVVALVLSRRAVDADARRPHRAFILWWGGLGAIGLVSAYFALGSPIGAYGLATARVLLYGLIALIFAMLGGLCYYLLYVYTGDHRNLRRVVAFYVALMALFVYVTESQVPAVDADGELVYLEERAPGDALSVVVSLGLLLPPLAAAGAYLGLFWKVDDRTSKYRIVLVSGGIVLWFTYNVVNSLAQNLLGVAESPFLARLAGQSLGVLAALMVLAAYLPPRFVQERYGVRSILQEASNRPETSRRAQPSTLHLAG